MGMNVKTLSNTDKMSSSWLGMVMSLACEAGIKMEMKFLPNYHLPYGSLFPGFTMNLFSMDMIDASLNGSEMVHLLYPMQKGKAPR